MTESAEQRVLLELVEFLNAEIKPLSKKPTMNNTEVAYRKVKTKLEELCAANSVEVKPRYKDLKTWIMGYTLHGEVCRGCGNTVLLLIEEMEKW